MKKLQNLILAIAALVILSVGGYLLVSNSNQQSEAPATKTSQQQVQAQIEVKIDYAGDVEKEAEVKNVDFKDGQTGWDALQSAVGIDNIGYQDYGGELGIFVQSINGVKPSGSKFWLFKVNGEGADVGVSAYKVQDGDKLEFVISEPSNGQ